ncbi:MAG: hypothetical protein KAJ78_04330 [Acidobacteria bacterium]|nr:hypothetical protein [Acidobacteriota bacterium]
MSNTESKASQTPENRRSRFSGLHARTYEMELLVSGALVFGLIHVPPVFDRWFTSFRASLDGTLRLLGTIGPAYLQMVLYALIATFVLHLMMRGFWIGLLGLESVFPDGIRWDHLKLGPATIKRYRAGIGSLAKSIEKVDDLCSLVFSFGFLIVFVFVYSVVVIWAVVALSFAISWAFLGGKGATILFWSLIALVVVLQQLAQSLDKFFGSRVKSGGVPETLIRLLVNIAYAVSPMRLVGTTQLTLGSNISDTKVGMVILGSVLTLGLFHIGGTFFGEGIVRIDSLTFFPDSLREQGMDPRHYRDLREPNSVEPKIPTIQKDIVAGPYLKLFIPYIPRYHNPLIASVCPNLQPLSKNGIDVGRGEKLDDAQVIETAACLGSLFQISLDGEHQQRLHFDFTVEPGTALEGIISFLPVDDFKQGRHELVILAPPKPGKTDEDTKTPEPVRHLIPFWL